MSLLADEGEHWSHIHSATINPDTVILVGYKAGDPNPWAYQFAHIHIVDWLVTNMQIDIENRV